MYVVCPDCNSELTSSADGEETVDLTCPKCGRIIDLQVDETLHYGQEDKPRLKQYELLSPVGRGAYGLVWRARDTQLDRIVAVKMPTRGELEPREADRFLKEAQAAGQLRHSNIVSVHDTGIEEGRPYIVSDFIEGVTLSAWLTGRSLALRPAAELCLTISRALHYAHENGIIHRDLKPSNILVDEQMQPFVTDFGLAKRVSEDATIAAHVSVLGTPSYMAPEQASGQSHYVDCRCDVYSLGVILFLLLTKEKPFRGNTQMVLHQVIHDDPPSPRKLNGKVPRDLETICLKCLEKTPKRRYESAGALAEDLQRYLEGKPIDARPVSLPERGWRWCQRRPAVAGLLISLFLSLSIGLIGVTFFWLDATEQGELTRQSLYRARMNLVATYYDSGDIAGVRQMLSRFSEDTRGADMRGFEWRYFDTLTAPFIQVANQGNVVDDVTVSRDGSLCAACSRDRQARVWDSRTGEMIRLISLDVGRINSVIFSPDSDELATGSSDGMVRIWDPVASDAVVRETKHGPPVILVRYSPEADLLLSAGNSGAVRIWDVNDLTVVAEIPSGMSRTVDVQFVPGEEQIAVAAEDGRIRIWNFRTRQQLQQITVPPLIQAIACSDDGQTIVVGSYSGVVRVISLRDDLPPLEHEPLWGRIDDIEFLPKTSVVAIVANDGGLHLFDIEEQREIRKQMTHTLATGALARSANEQILSVGSGNGAIQLVRLDDLMTPSIFWHETDVRDVEFLSRGERMVGVDSDGELRIWDVATGGFESLATDTGTRATTLSAQLNGPWIASGGDGPQVTLWDRNSLAAVDQISVSEFGDAGVTHVEFSSSGLLLGLVVRQGPVRVYQTNGAPELAFEIPASESKVNALAFSTDDRWLAVALEDGRIELSDGQSGVRQDGSMRVPNTPFALTFCEDNRVLAVGTDSGEIQLWDVDTQTLRTNIKGHSSRISALSVLPDGMTLVSGGRDQQLRLWDTPSGELITTLTGHNRQVFAISVSPAGDAIASGGLEGDIRIWRATAR